MKRLGLFFLLLFSTNASAQRAVGKYIQMVPTTSGAVCASGKVCVWYDTSTNALKVRNADATDSGTGGAAAPLTLSMTAIATAQTAGLTMSNTTAATSGATVQNSPGLVFSGHVWNTGGTPADNAQSMEWQLVPVSASTPYNQMVLCTANNGGTCNAAWTFGRSFGSASLINNSDTVVYVGTATSQVAVDNATVYLRPASTFAVLVTAGNMTPNTDGGTALGTKTNRWGGSFNSGSESCGFNSQSGTTYTALTTDCIIFLTNTAARTVTLPLANSFPAGGKVPIYDGAATAGSANISVARTGSDTINTGTSTIAVVTINNAKTSCVSDGVSKWTCPVNN